MCVDIEDAGLRARWARLLPGATELADPLLERWSEPHRRHHTVEHLREVLDHIARLAEPCHDQQLVALAAWYHDAVYQVPSGEIGNEEASARLAEHELAGHLGAEQVCEVGRLVRLTADHRAAPGDADGALLCDADLAILAADENTYLSYTAAIRAEYHHVPRDRYRQGRRAILTALLEQRPLFRTPRGTQLEDAARRNVAAEIDRLSGGDGADAAR